MQHGAALAGESGDESLQEAVASGRFHELDERMRVMCEYAVKLTVAPYDMTEADIGKLRALGLDDRAIVDVNQVVAYFNYVNRVADGLGIELEQGWPEEVRAHRRYGLGRDS